jgi:6-phosphogluconolactonase
MKNFSLLFLTLLCSMVNAQNKEYTLLIGTYTNSDKSNGIHVFRFNAGTGEFNEKAKNTEKSNLSYLAVSKDKKHVYAVSELGEGNGAVNAFSFDVKSGALTFINSVNAAGDHPCYVSVDNKKKVVLVGTYSGGSLSAIRVNKDGSLNPEVQTITRTGGSVNKERQEKAHVHAVVLSPDNKFLFVPDLGSDKVAAYKVDATSDKPLTAAGETSVKGGSGPRHFEFHPNGKYAYLIQELDATVTLFDYKGGKLTERQTLPLTAAGFKGNVGASDIHVSPDGKFLYGANRGDANELTIFSIAADGKLTFVGRQSTLGKTPRNFAIDPSGNFLLAANQNSDEVVIFKRDQKTGLLSDTGKRINLGKPVCLKFVR